MLLVAIERCPTRGSDLYAPAKRPIETMLAEHDSQFEDAECAVCGSDRTIVESDSTITCQDCRKSYALVLHDEFALLETDGWTAGITLDRAGPRGPN